MIGTEKTDIQQQDALDMLRKHRDELGNPESSPSPVSVRSFEMYLAPIVTLTFLSSSNRRQVSFRLQHHLEDLFERRVDSASPAVLKRQLRDRILKESVHAE